MLRSPRLSILVALLVGCGGRSAYIEADDSSAGGPSTPPSGGSAGEPSDAGTSAGGSVATGGSGEGASAGDSTPATGGTTSTGGSASTGGTTSTGGSAGWDANCYPGLAVSGAECTMNCSVPCGFADLGTRTCTCTGGYFSACHCPRPLEYQGAPTAPPCDTADGRALPLKNTPCDTEWAQCIGNDPTESSSPRGCACLRNSLNGDRLQWFCGSTNRWFFPE